MINFIRLENLPNELIIHIFQYLDARTLYRSFYNLNNRLNNLLKSLTRLCLILWPFKTDDYDHLFTSRVHTLVVHCDVNFTLAQYVNLHHLVLFNSKSEQISQLIISGSHLERISLISPRCFYSTFTFNEMIFSNQFPSLKFCSLTSVYSPSLQIRQLSWSQSPSLQSLSISSCDSLIHVAILNACPNLRVLHLSLRQLDRTPLLEIKPHRNLKQLKFILNKLAWPADEMIFETFFAFIPCLERLTIQRFVILPEIIQFDYLKKIIDEQLVGLQQFQFSLQILSSDQIKCDEFEENLCQIRKNFVKSFSNNQYYYLYIKIQ